MLTSQLAALEPLDADEQHILLDINESPAALVEQAHHALTEAGAARLTRTGA
jgi:gluconokinase